MAEALESGEVPNAVTPDGWTPVLLAAREGHLSVVEALLQAGAHLHVAHPNGRSALHFAARNGHAEMANLLVLRGLHVDSRTKFGVTPLIEAARGNHPNLVQDLVALGADPERPDSGGRTASDWLGVGGELGEAEKLFRERRPELVDGLVPASAGLEAAVRRKMAEEPNADRYAAVHGRNVWCCSYGLYRFHDGAVHAWAHRLAAILAGRKLLTECEERFLTGEELEEARAVRAKDERRARRYRTKNWPATQTA